MIEKDVYKLNEKANIVLNINEEDKKRFTETIEWCGNALELNVKERLVRKLFPKQGEIWTVNFGVNIGSETNKIRPALIIQQNDANEKAPTTIAIPITSHVPCFVTQIPLNKEDVQVFDDYCKRPEGTLMFEKVRVISKARLGTRIGKLSPEKIQEVQQMLNSMFLFVDNDELVTGEH